jgi:predicted secreted protein
MQARLLMPAALLAALTFTASPAAAKQVTLTIADTGTTVSVHQGDTIAIALPANQTTPYHWVVTWRPRPAVARVASSRYVQGTSGLPGAPGTQRYRLKATGAGRTAFAAEYQEISSGTIGTGKSTFSVTVRVR